MKIVCVFKGVGEEGRARRPRRAPIAHASGAHGEGGATFEGLLGRRSAAALLGLRVLAAQQE